MFISYALRGCIYVDVGKDGSFLVRESTTTTDSYALSVRQEERVTHIMIRQNPETAQLDVGGGQQFATLNELVAYYRDHPMVANTGAVVMLKHPFFATRFAAFTIVARVRELDRLECASLASMAAPNTPTATHSAPGSASGGTSRPLPDPDLAGYSRPFLCGACLLSKFINSAQPIPLHASRPCLSFH